MTASKQQDNSTFEQNLRLRRAVLHAAPPEPVVLETHGGFGRLYERAWFKARTGVVVEKVEGKAAALAEQRPTWRVYQADSLKALRAGIAADLRFDIVDLDPYGSPHDYLDALASSGRTWPDSWHLVVNDGLRQSLALGGAWHSDTMAWAVQKHGNNLHPIYLRVAREAVERFAERLGYLVAGWHGYYTGANSMMTHYWARIERKPGAK